MVASFCPIEEWKLTSDGAANTVLTNIQNTVTRAGGKTIVRVTDTTSNKSTFGTFKFYLTYKARGGGTKTTPEITL